MYRQGWVLGPVLGPVLSLVLVLGPVLGTRTVPGSPVVEAVYRQGWVLSLVLAVGPGMGPPAYKPLCGP